MGSNTRAVAAITDPSGAYKNVIGEKLARQLGPRVNTDTDHIKHMIVSDFCNDDSAGGWGFNQWGLTGGSIGLLARNFLDTGYSVVINGCIDALARTNIHKHVSFAHNVLLLPCLATTTNRDVGRRAGVGMGAEVTNDHNIRFSTDKLFNDLTKLGITSHSVDKTLDQISEIVRSHEQIYYR